MVFTQGAPIRPGNQSVSNDARNGPEPASSPSLAWPSLAALAHAYAVSGKRGQALRLLSRLKELELSKQEYVSAYDLAVIYTGLGEKDQAFKSLERAYEQRDGWMALWLKTDPRLDPLRADQRFASLLRRIGLPQ